MKVEASNLAKIFSCALYDEVEQALRRKIFIDDRGLETLDFDETLKAIRDILGVEDNI